MTPFPNSLGKMLIFGRGDFMSWDLSMNQMKMNIKLG